MEPEISVYTNPSLFPAWARWIQSTPSHHIYSRSVFVLRNLH